MAAPEGGQPPMENKTYPGVEFVPPEGSIDGEAMEGEGVVQWRKVDGKFTMISFEGRPLKAPAMAEESTPVPAYHAEIDQLAKE